MALGTNRPKRWQIMQPAVVEELPQPSQLMTAAKLHRRLGSVSPRLFQSDQASDVSSAVDNTASVSEPAAEVRRRGRPPKQRE